MTKAKHILKKIFLCSTSGKELISKIQKELTTVNTYQTTLSQRIVESEHFQKVI